MVIKALEAMYHQIKEKPAGRRFRDFYDERRAQMESSTLRKIAYPTIGGVCIIIGILLSLPGIPGPGSIIFFVGLGMMAMASRLFAALLDHAESKMRQLFSSIVSRLKSYGNSHD